MDRISSSVNTYNELELKLKFDCFHKIEAKHRKIKRHEAKLGPTPHSSLDIQFFTQLLLNHIVAVYLAELSKEEF
ncbi:hypothetical protein Y032_0024g989 [Ancylostoma ceylanicum]|uniref:Uncharacterized protein n=1 Tax=Ancylostoma ceylanicum TaxID=53326 RepID=A0A016UXB7_9BILA|nr:hypothetical protein Y032_0024g989 [Ancylostoma ceylanicum]